MQPARDDAQTANQQHDPEAAEHLRRADRVSQGRRHQHGDR